MPLLTSNDVTLLNALIRRVNGIRGDGVSNTPEGITISWPPSAADAGETDDEWFILRITSAAGGGAIYKARRQVPSRSAQMNGNDPATDLDLSSMLEDRMSRDDSAYWNLSESATSQHAIKVDGTAYVLAKAVPFKTNFSPALPVFASNVAGEGLPPGGFKFQAIVRVDDGPAPSLIGGQAGWRWFQAHSYS